MNAKKEGKVSPRAYPDLLAMTLIEHEKSLEENIDRLEGLIRRFEALLCREEKKE